jgi:cytochrome c-type biogenesis protein CcmH
MDFLVDRYGEFVLLTPRFSLQTALLWAAPVLLLIAGGAAAFGVMRRRSGGAGPAAPALTKDEQAALDRILSKPGS